MGAEQRTWKLVIADDSPEYRADLRRLLLMATERRYQILEVETAADTCSAILDPDAEIPTCLILDFHLPDAEAPEVIGELMTRRGIPVCPIVVITGTSRGDVGTLAIQAGAQDFVGKNWLTRESLTRSIENAVSRWRMTRNLAVHLGVVEILSAVTDEEEQLANSLELIVEEMNWHAGTIWSVDSAQTGLACKHYWERSGKKTHEQRSNWSGRTRPFDTGLAEYVWRHKTCAWWSAGAIDNPSNSTVESEWLRQAGFLFAIAFPILHHDECLGIVECYCRTPIEHDPELARLLEGIGIQLGLAIKRTRAERKIRGNEEQLRRLVRYYDFFIGVLGHDLRNPLAAILTGAELGLRVASDDKSKALWRKIKSSGQRMQRLIEQLLDVTRIRSGGLALQRTPMNLADITRTTMDELAGAHGEGLIHLQIQGNVTGEWDADRLAQVLSNLIGNALQYALGSRQISVRISELPPDHVEFSVHNEGSIPSDLLPTLFDPFVRAAHGTHKAGLGLGLYISQQIIIAHGGQICVQSEESTGTTFRVVLPRHTTDGPLNEANTPDRPSIDEINP
jgi:signal transduction histidine kinase/FixJ family two-component response regulator